MMRALLVKVLCVLCGMWGRWVFCQLFSMGVLLQRLLSDLFLFLSIKQLKSWGALGLQSPFKDCCFSTCSLIALLASLEQQGVDVIESIPLESSDSLVCYLVNKIVLERIRAMAGIHTPMLPSMTVMDGISDLEALISQKELCVA